MFQASSTPKESSCIDYDNHSNKIIFINPVKSFKNIQGHLYKEKLNIVRYIQPENITIIKTDGASIATIDSFSVTLICRDKDEKDNHERRASRNLVRIVIIYIRMTYLVVAAMS